MNSCLYECSVMHHRLAPKEHHFRHDIFMLYLDLDELETVARAVRCFSHNGRNLYAFRDADHLPLESRSDVPTVAVGFSPRFDEGEEGVAERRLNEADPAVVSSIVAPRREPLPEPDRGLKPTATFTASLREEVEAKDLPTASATKNLKMRMVDYLHTNGVPFDLRGRIMLLTLPRVAGYIFNPVSIYYCFGPAGEPLCAIAEVGNTFGEMKLFLLRADDLRDGQVFRKLTTKHFYVSPFSSLELSFDFQLRVPGEKLDVRIDDRDGDNKILLTTLTGTRAALSHARLLWFTLKYPLVTLKVIALIHWHAFVLWLKRVPVHRKADQPTLQTDVLRPHSTLAARPK